ncbi:hypothetical protein B0H11DRAFT_1692337, partial [Mycena galericulata]
MLHDRTSCWMRSGSGRSARSWTWYVSELVCIHTKLMIVDGQRIIMGSANLNHRSQKVSDGDSEIALVVEDEDIFESTMDGEPYQVAHFATTLPCKIFR